MKNVEDISILLTGKKFQEILKKWPEFGEAKREEILTLYGISEADMNVLLQVWAGLRFRAVEYSPTEIEDAYEETLWKIAAQKRPNDSRFGIKIVYKYFSKVAAILLLPLLLYAIYVGYSKAKLISSISGGEPITVVSQPGTLTNLVLPDGTKVCLNAGSSISYPNHFYGSVRNVQLSGEAYFQVTKNKHFPMVIATDKLKLKVYGTSFNVNAFPGEDFERVTLVEGSISLSGKQLKFNGKDELFVVPGQTVSFYGSQKKLVIENKDTFPFTAWKDGILVFRNTSFQKVLKRLSRRFNVDLQLKDNSLAELPLDATFKDENVNEILRLLELSIPFEYSYEQPQKLPDGTFQKSKIDIVKRQN